jgi:hypothetical protein
MIKIKMTSLQSTQVCQSKQSEEEFNKVSLEQVKSISNKVRLVDSDENNKLELYCYLNYQEGVDDPLMEKCRGVIFSGDKLVVPAYPYTQEIIDTDESLIKEEMGNNLNDYSIFESHEGCLIRMFWYGDRWNISTHRKLNAFRSKWASKESFGTNFKRAIDNLYNCDENFRNIVGESEHPLFERYQNVLDKNKQYMFLLKNTFDNRIVCVAPEEPVVYHVGTIMDGKFNIRDDCYIPRAHQLYFENIDDMIYYLKNNIDVTRHQGLICFSNNNDKKHLKLIKEEYNAFFNARGNESSIKFRYLQVRVTNADYVDKLHVLYPHMCSTYQEIENIISQIGAEIYSSYVNRFIRKKFVTLPTEDYAVMRECHKWHESDRNSNRVSEEKIMEILNKQTPSAINKMIRRWKVVKETSDNNIENSKRKHRSNTITRENENTEKNPDLME